MIIDGVRFPDIPEWLERLRRAWETGQAQMDTTAPPAATGSYANDVLMQNIFKTQATQPSYQQTAQTLGYAAPAPQPTYQQTAQTLGYAAPVPPTPPAPLAAPQREPELIRPPTLRPEAERLTAQPVMPPEALARHLAPAQPPGAVEQALRTAGQVYEEVKEIPAVKTVGGVAGTVLKALNVPYEKISEPFVASAWQQYQKGQPFGLEYAAPEQVEQFRQEAPWYVQLGAGVLFDPLNLVAFGLGKVGRAAQLRKAVRHWAPAALGVDDVAAQLTREGQRANSLLGRVSPFQLTPAAMGTKLVNEAVDVVNLVTRNSDAPAVLLANFVKDPDTVADLTGGISRSLPAKRTAALLRRMFADEAGTVDPQAIIKLMNQAKGNELEAVALLARKMQDAAESFFPLRKKGALTKGRDTINNYLSMGFMGLNPAYAFRNAANNLFTLLVDGMFPLMSSATKRRWWVRFGGMPIAGKAAIGGAGAAWQTRQGALQYITGLEEITPLKDVFKGARGAEFFLTTGQNFERISSEAAVTAAAMRTWGKVWPKTVRAMEPELRQMGLPRETIELLMRELRQAMNPQEVKAVIQKVWGGGDLAQSLPMSVVDRLDDVLGEGPAGVVADLIKRPGGMGAARVILQQADQGAEAVEAVRRVAMTSDEAIISTGMTDFFTQMDDILAGAIRNDKAARNAVWELTTPLTRAERAPIWEAFWAQRNANIRSLNAELDAIYAARLPDLGFTSEDITAFATQRVRLAGAFQKYSAELSATWAKSDATKVAKHRTAIWAKFDQWAENHWLAWQADNGLFIQQRDTMISKALAKLRGGKAGPGAAAAPAPKPPRKPYEPPAVLGERPVTPPPWEPGPTIYAGPPKRPRKPYEPPAVLGERPVTPRPWEEGPTIYAGPPKPPASRLAGMSSAELSDEIARLVNSSAKTTNAKKIAQIDAELNTVLAEQAQRLAKKRYEPPAVLGERPVTPPPAAAPPVVPEPIPPKPPPARLPYEPPAVVSETERFGVRRPGPAGEAIPLGGKTTTQAPAPPAAARVEAVSAPESGTIIARTAPRESLADMDVSFFTEYRVRPVPESDYEMVREKYGQAALSELLSGNKPTVFERRRVDVRQGVQTPNDWDILTFAGSPEKAVEIAESALLGAESLDPLHATWVSYVRRRNELDSELATLRERITPHKLERRSPLVAEFEAEYERALKDAKLFSKAQKGTVPQDKIDAIRKPIQEKGKAEKARIEARIEEIEAELAGLERARRPIPGLRDLGADVAHPFDPHFARRQGAQEAMKLLDELEGGVPSQIVGPLTPDLAQQLRLYGDNKIIPAMLRDKAVTGRVATVARNFALGDYSQRRNINEWLQWIFPYHFWYTFTYRNWAQRVLQNPAILSNYARFKRVLKDINTDYYREVTGDPEAAIPEYWERDIRVPMFGTDFYVNLERLVNPLQALVEDFRPAASEKAPGGSLVRSIGASGPSIWAPWIWAYTKWLWDNGYREAAQEWSGYLFPFARPLKSVTALLKEQYPEAPIPAGGTTAEELIGLPTVEGGDIWERKRIGYFLMRLWRDGLIDETTFENAAYSQEGPAWERARQMEAIARATYNLSAFAIGMGFRTRDKTDFQIQRMWDDWGQLMDARDTMSKDERSRAFDAFDDRWPWAKEVRLSRAVDPWARLHDFAYMVLDRLPPGTAFREAVSSVPGYDKWRANKQDFEGWAPEEVQAFQQGIEALAGQYDVPTPDQVAEFELARWAHDERLRQAAHMVQSQGHNVSLEQLRTVESDYYDIPQEQRRAYRDAHPELVAFWEAKRAVDQQGLEGMTADQLKAFQDKYYYSSTATAARGPAVSRGGGGGIGGRGVSRVGVTPSGSLPPPPAPPGSQPLPPGAMGAPETFDNLTAEGYAGLLASARGSDQAFDMVAQAMFGRAILTLAQQYMSLDAEGRAKWRAANPQKWGKLARFLRWLQGQGLGGRRTDYSRLLASVPRNAPTPPPTYVQ